MNGLLVIREAADILSLGEGVRKMMAAFDGRDSWPNLMVEVWFSESLRMLRLDAQWWFLASGGVNQISKLRITRSSSHPNVPTMTFSV